MSVKLFLIFGMGFFAGCFAWRDPKSKTEANQDRSIASVALNNSEGLQVPNRANKEEEIKIETRMNLSKTEKQIRPDYQSILAKVRIEDLFSYEKSQRQELDAKTLVKPMERSSAKLNRRFLHEAAQRGMREKYLLGHLPIGGKDQLSFLVSYKYPEETQKGSDPRANLIVAIEREGKLLGLASHSISVSSSMNQANGKVLAESVFLPFEEKGVARTYDRLNLFLPIFESISNGEARLRNVNSMRWEESEKPVEWKELSGESLALQNATWESNAKLEGIGRSGSLVSASDSYEGEGGSEE